MLGWQPGDEQLGPVAGLPRSGPAGTRITVQSVLELVREGLPFAEIRQDYYPELSAADIQACIQYAIEIVPAEDIHITATAG